MSFKEEKTESCSSNSLITFLCVATNGTVSYITPFIQSIRSISSSDWLSPASRISESYYNGKSFYLLWQHMHLRSFLFCDRVIWIAFRARTETHHQCQIYILWFFMRLLATLGEYAADYNMKLSLCLSKWCPPFFLSNEFSWIYFASELQECETPVTGYLSQQRSSGVSTVFRACILSNSIPVLIMYMNDWISCCSFITLLLKTKT